MNKLPKGWEWKTLGEISLSKGQYGSGARKVDFDGKVRYIRITDMEDDGSLSNEYVSPSEIEQDCFLEKDDLLFARSGSVGRTYLHTKNDMTYQYAGYLIRFRINPKMANVKYIFYVTKSPYYYNWVESLKRNVTISNINAQEYGSFEIPIPPLPIQKQIVEILEKAESLKNKRYQSNDDTNKLIQSLYYSMFGNPETNLKKWKEEETQELFDMKLGKMLSAKNYTGKNLRPYLRNINVQWGSLDLSDVKEMDFDEKEFERYQLKKGDILVTEGGDVGRTAIYAGEIKGCCYQNALHRLRIKKPVISSLYFIHLMKSASDCGLITKTSSKVTIAHFTAEQFKKFKIMLPPIELQNKFASIVEMIDSIREHQKESTKEVNQLFDALMQKAFAGELV